MLTTGAAHTHVTVVALWQLEGLSVPNRQIKAELTTKLEPVMVTK
jgi:hypothetical protein